MPPLGSEKVLNSIAFLSNSEVGPFCPSAFIILFIISMPKPLSFNLLAPPSIILTTSKADFSPSIILGV